MTLFLKEAYVKTFIPVYNYFDKSFFNDHLKELSL